MFKLSIRFFLCFFLITQGRAVFCQQSPPSIDSAQRKMIEEEAADDGEDTGDTAYLSSGVMTSPYEFRKVPVEEVRKFQRDPVFAYANDPEYWKKDPPPANSGWLADLFASRAVRMIFLILFLLVIAFGIYQLVKENTHGLMQFRRKKKQSPASVVAAPEERSVADLEAAIHRYVAEGNYNEAVRFLYLRLIRNAFEKNVIHISAASTNSQIVEAFRDAGQARDFRFLATAYEQVFFGGFTPGVEQFRLLEEKFNAFHKHWEN